MGLPASIARAASLLPVVAAVGLAGCGGEGGASTADGSPPPARSGAAMIEISDFAYHPGTITVPEGTTITFANHDETAHTATAKSPGAFDTEAIQPGKSATVTLDEAGSFAYYCAFHPFMKGTIEVE